jgi:hypothetical protein
MQSLTLSPEGPITLPFTFSHEGSIYRVESAEVRSDGLYAIKHRGVLAVARIQFLPRQTVRVSSLDGGHVEMLERRSVEIVGPVESGITRC